MATEAIEVIDKNRGRILGHLHDLIELITAPRRFLRRVPREEPHVLAWRLGLYVLAFAVYESALSVALLDASSPGQYALLGSAMAELVCSTILLPALYGTALVQRIKRPFATAATYAVAFRCVYLSIPLFFFVLFLSTEDYVFAYVKGAATFAYIIAVVAAFPLFVGRTLRQRVVGVLAMLTLATLTFVGLGYVPVLNVAGNDLTHYSLTGDPIEREVHMVDGDIPTFGDSAHFGEAIAVVETMRRDTLLVFDPPLRRQWLAVFPRARNALTLAVAQLDSEETKTHFRTTKRLLDDRRRVLMDEVSLLGTADTLVHTPSIGSYRAYEARVARLNTDYVSAAHTQIAFYKTVTHALESGLVTP